MRILIQSLALFVLISGALPAQQATYANTAGTVTLGSNFTIASSSVASPSGTYSFNCPVTALPPGTYSAQWACTGGTITITSFDGLTVVNGTMTSGTVTETASGGGIGHPTTYYYSFSGTFTGTLTVNGQAQAVRGTTSQALAGTTASPLGTGTIATGSTSINAAYEPVYFTDTYNYRVVRMDNMNGDNWTSIGTFGTGVNQFSLPWGLYVDTSHKIYVTDSATCRVIRMDDMKGTNWSSVGSCGASSLQFNNPTGVAVDRSGNIYVDDTGNNRIVRMSDIAGDGWTVLGTQGNGVGQFSGPQGIALDKAGKIYVADSGNARIVRMDNMAGANWVSFSASSTGTDQLGSPLCVTLDAAGKIYVADTYADRIVRVDDMTGANWTVLGGPSGSYSFINPYGVGVDPFGTIYVTDSRGYRLVMTDNMSGLAWTTYGTGGTGIGGVDSPTNIMAVPPATPTAEPTLTATKFTYANTVIGTSSAPQTVTLANIGAAPLSINSITAAGDFGKTSTCSTSLPAGQSCTVTITFKPTAGGARTGSVTFNLGSAGIRTVTLSGLGVLVSVNPLTVAFGSVPAGFRPVSINVTVANPGAAAAAISSITLKGSPVYRLVNHCPTSLAAAASCTLTIKFSPQAAQIYNGTLTITDGTNTSQVVPVSGTGTSN